MSLKLGPNKGKGDRIRKRERKDQVCLFCFGQRQVITMWKLCSVIHFLMTVTVPKDTGTSCYMIHNQ